MKKNIYRYIDFFLISLFFLAVGFFAVSHYFHQKELKSMVETKEQNTVGSERIGYCKEELLNSSVTIYLSDNLDFGVQGVFTTNIIDQNNIFLSRKGGQDIDTISHEVHHLVDSIVEKRKIKDEETEAYLQGYYTDCVYKLLDPNMEQNIKLINNIRELCDGSWYIDTKLNDKEVGEWGCGATMFVGEVENGVWTKIPRMFGGSCKKGFHAVLSLNSESVMEWNCEEGDFTSVDLINN